MAQPKNIIFKNRWYTGAGRNRDVADVWKPWEAFAHQYRKHIVWFDVTNLAKAVRAHYQLLHKVLLTEADAECVTVAFIGYCMANAEKRPSLFQWEKYQHGMTLLFDTKFSTDYFRF